MNFCRRCGTRLTNVQNHIFRCENDHTIFANANPTVGIFFVTSDNKVILSERGIEPHKGMLDSFGGFVDSNETLEQAAIRELKEEANLDTADYENLKYLCSAYGNYPYQGDNLPVLSTFYWTRLLANKELTPSDDVAAVHYIHINEVDSKLLHDDDVRHGFSKLQELFSEN